MSGEGPSAPEPRVVGDASSGPPTATQSPRERFAARIDRARHRMQSVGIDVIGLSAGSDLTYLCGYEAMPLERLTLLVVGQWGEPTLVVPELEAARVDDLDGLLRLRPWADGEDMIAVAARELRQAGGAAPAVAVGDRMWAGVLLGLQESLRHSRFSSAGEVLRPLRLRKTHDEIQALRQAAHAVDGITGEYRSMAWEGRTEAAVAQDIAAMLLDRGHEEVNFVIVASGPNGASPHHTAADRVIGRGDVVVVDIGGKMHGYCSDITRCVSIGPASESVRAAYEALRVSQEAAAASVRPGVTAEEIDAVARDQLTESGYGERFIHRTGHGIGLDEHEDPYIVAGNTELIEAGMCFSIEPGVYLPDRFGLRLEDIVAVDEDGVDVLNEASHDLVETE